MHLGHGPDRFSVFQSKRDILSETKYIELVLVADHQEVSERTTAHHLLRGRGLLGISCV